jgi:hypothetical protein
MSIIVFVLRRATLPAFRNVIFSSVTLFLNWWKENSFMSKAAFLKRDGVINRKAPEVRPGVRLAAHGQTRIAKSEKVR